MLSGAIGQRFGCWSRERIARSRPLNHLAPCRGARATPHRHSSSRSASAFLAISTRYGMLPAEPGEHLLCRFRAAGLHIRQSPLNAFDRFDAVEQRLIGLGVLHDTLRLAIDRQNEGMPGLSEAVQEVDRVALEVTERTDVVSHIQHAR